MGPHICNSLIADSSILSLHFHFDPLYTDIQYKIDIDLQGDVMLLDWAVIFLVLAIVAGIFGFGGIASESAWIAKVLFVVFIVIYILSFLFNRTKNS